MLSLQSSCTWIRPWCYRGIGKDEGNSNNGGGKTGYASVTTSLSRSPVEAEADSIRLPSWMQTETTATAVATRTGSGHDTKSLEGDARDTKPERLLLQHHIPVVQIIDAFYSVCTYTRVYHIYQY